MCVASPQETWLIPLEEAQSMEMRGDSWWWREVDRVSQGPGEAREGVGGADTKTHITIIL